MKTSTAESKNYKCPKCGDDLTQDRKGQGFVRHKSNSDCYYEKGDRDHPTLRLGK